MIGRTRSEADRIQHAFGDPETQVILPRIDDDLLTLLTPARGKLDVTEIVVKPDAR